MDVTPRPTGWKMDDVLAKQIEKAASFRASKQFSDAEVTLRRILDQSPQDEAALTEYARTASARKDWEEATRRWKQVTEVSSGKAQPRAVANLAHAYRRLGDLPAAEAVLKPLIEAGTQNVFVLAEYAEISTKRKKWAEAVERLALLASRVPEGKIPAGVQKRLEKLKSQVESHDLKAQFQELIVKRVAAYNGYHPVYARGAMSRSASRDCDDRWAMIEALIKELGIKSFVDIGCAEGFFVRKAAEAGCFAIGVDQSANILELPEAAKTLDHQRGCGFVISPLSSELVSAIPSFDMIVCCSMMHHVIRQYGLDTAKGYLRGLSTKYNKCFFFDMASTLETGSIPSQLPDMGAAPELWIHRLLVDCGFDNIEQIGTTTSPKGEVRYVFRSIRN
jgi:2-polyprenyl-3-methyl-5-hydroxy-6-metoxy-1,4-benzoquinol methylase